MTPRYEPIIIRRASEGTDPYGDPIPGDFVDHLTLSGKFAPNNPDEPVEVGRNVVITGGTVYMRDLTVRPDVLATDRAVIRGVELEIDGEVGAWLRAESWAIQFAVKKVTPP